MERFRDGPPVGLAHILTISQKFSACDIQRHLDIRSESWGGICGLAAQRHTDKMQKES